MRKIKYVLGTLVTVFTITVTKAQPNFDWAVSIGGATGHDIAYDTKVDQNGNVYVTGYISGTVDFDPSPGTLNLTSSGGRDAYLAKYTSSGAIVWAKLIGSGSSTVYGKKMAVDTNGDLVIVGNFSGSADFDPGVGTTILSSNGSQDWFVQKISSSGNLIWANSAGSVSGDDVRGVSVSPNGDVTYTGYFAGTTDFDPGAGTFNMTPNNSGWEDAFLVRLDMSGNFLWAKSVQSSTAGTYGWGVINDASGSVYWSGSYVGTADLNPNAGIQNETNNGQDDIFLIKLSSTGTFNWALAYGGSANDVTRDIKLDGLGNIITVGMCNGGMDMNPGAGTNTMSTNGGYDLFVQKLDPSGNYIWGRSFGGVNNDWVEGLWIDTDNDVYLTGHFDGSVDFDPTAGVFNIVSTGGYDSYIEKINDDGSFGWAVSHPGSGTGGGGGICVDGANEVYFAGSHDATSDFDHTTNTYNITSLGMSDGVLVKISQCLSTTSTISPSACTSYTSPSGNYIWTTSNTYLDTIQNAGGCDSIITINLTITGPSNGTDVITACNSYTWIDNNTYTSSNSTATHTIVGGNSMGCDSVVTLNLTINNATAGTDVQTACGSYTWIDNNTYTSSNTTATHTLVSGNSVGCDSVVTLNLTINTVDNTTSTQGNDSISANQAGATYQWLDCDNSFAIISGATNQLFVASTNGNYAVQVTQNGCTDTSACVQVIGVGIDEENSENAIFVYPNPNNGLFTVKMITNKSQTVDLSIINITGETIGNWKLKNQLSIDLSNYAKGIYFLQLVTEKDKVIKKIVVQ